MVKKGRMATLMPSALKTKATPLAVAVTATMTATMTTAILQMKTFLTAVGKVTTTMTRKKNQGNESLIVWQKNGRGALKQRNKRLKLTKKTEKSKESLSLLKSLTCRSTAHTAALLVAVAVAATTLSPPPIEFCPCPSCASARWPPFWTLKTALSWGASRGGTARLASSASCATLWPQTSTRSSCSPSYSIPQAQLFLARLALCHSTSSPSSR
mmetsp:Transcript_85906/g.171951  ORF Transcript_85906/g.171951 Transcript_85906/m.171951 type:complete len:213 (+) Transcript_85906:232-870(+)